MFFPLLHLLPLLLVAGVAGLRQEINHWWRWAELPVTPWVLKIRHPPRSFSLLFVEGMKKRASSWDAIFCICVCVKLIERLFTVHQHSRTVTSGDVFGSLAWLSYLSNASDKFRLHNYAVVFILVKSCLLSRPHQVVRGSLHRVSGSL